MPLRLILDFSRIKAGIMLDRKTIERLGGWEGYRVERVVWPEGESRGHDLPEAFSANDALRALRQPMSAGA
ncbi:transposase, ISL3 family [Bordetella holmesii CDC-H809-BH]|nr:transposase, ISL3 family [Bordetella holmesii CDC-H809-BH]KAK76963.1 transposase, ISL3 family [Bordetella holmesii CDC-H809-BH]KAK80023.1 transposase, ISL3 family [Bordetella holmesii CDC-H809-BH]KAK80805.1 transposase, ISL3 family [Bordetella holmesii CDC-H809-BH]KAK81713.1 transposase, ISL3 family [Bordetella holmesii CDC-H809-BH]